jgi:hypothetical protein
MSDCEGGENYPLSKLNPNVESSVCLDTHKPNLRVFICRPETKGFAVFPDINFIEKNFFERARTELIK